MFWWFEREGTFLRLEVLQLTADKYELRVIDADGNERVETLASADDVAKRQKELQDALSGEGVDGSARLGDVKTA